ncbi:hypothetical protein L3V86_01985 [Thiotrichales bacterium 19S11-10]|nr:hypothetical protein [Thiotrichales bacterium 19S11-10]
MQPTNFPFGKELKPYRYGEIETPFLSKKQQYDAPIGQWRQRAYSWRLLFFVNIGIALLLVLYLILILSVRPFSIAVVSTTPEGHVKGVYKLDLNNSADISIYHGFIQKGIQQFLSSKDSAGMGAYFSPNSVNQLEQFFKGKPTENIRLKQCQFINKGQIVCQLHYGTKQASEKVNIMLLITSKVPNNVGEIKYNPLGLFIKNITFQPDNINESKR